MSEKPSVGEDLAFCGGFAAFVVGLGMIHPGLLLATIGAGFLWLSYALWNERKNS